MDNMALKTYIFYTIELRPQFIFDFVLVIAQIAPFSFQAAIPHKPRQVRWGEVHASMVTEWLPACLHKKLQRGHHTGN